MLIEPIELARIKIRPEIEILQALKVGDSIFCSEEKRHRALEVSATTSSAHASCLGSLPSEKWTGVGGLYGFNKSQLACEARLLES